MQTGKYIVIEGLDGAGKSTMVEKLLQELERKGVKVIVTREPGGTAFAEDIRTAIKTPRSYAVDGLTEALAFSAARRDNWLNVVKPALDAGTWVISDRSYLSMLAYQGYGRGHLSDIEQLFRLTYGDQFKFHACFVLDVGVEFGLNNSKRRGGEQCRIEALDKEIFERARLAFNDQEMMSKYCDNYAKIDMEETIANNDSDELAAWMGWFAIG